MSENKHILSEEVRKMMLRVMFPNGIKASSEAFRKTICDHKDGATLSLYENNGNMYCFKCGVLVKPTNTDGFALKEPPDIEEMGRCIRKLAEIWETGRNT